MRKLPTNSENPYYGFRQTLTMYQTLGKDGSFSSTELHKLLNAAYKECSTNLELFFSVFFSIGDITDRNHNLFSGMKVDAGGNGNRQIFINMLIWLHSNHEEYFYRFLPLIVEYTVFENIFYYQLRTDRNKGTLLSVTHIPVNPEKLATHVAPMFKSASNNQLVLWSKYLSRPRFSTRQVVKDGEVIGRRTMKAETVARMRFKEQFLIALSNEMGWEIEQHENNRSFSGFYAWKKQLNRNLESVVFAEHTVTEMDAAQFNDWLETLPSGARYRVRRRLLDKNDEVRPKWQNKFGQKLGNLFLNWEKHKEQAQQELRIVNEKIRNGEDVEPGVIAQLKKDAKVNTGASNLESAFMNLLRGSRDPLLIDSLLSKVKFEIPVLVVGDVSGSMDNRTSNGFSARTWAGYLATVAMLKNPEVSGGELLLTFSSNATIHGQGLSVLTQKNKFVSPTKEQMPVRLIDRTKSFDENYRVISKILSERGGSTNLTSISETFERWVNADAEQVELRRETLQNYPIILVISDGDLNNANDATRSMAQFKRQMLNIGWDGVVVLWSVVDAANMRARTNYYEDIENVIHYTGTSPSVLSNIFEKLHDVDIVDIYTPLQSLMRSNRYEPVRHIIASKQKRAVMQ